MMSLPIDFLAGLAHELRTPLGAIGGYAELMELGVHGPVTPAQADGLGRIRRNQQLMVSLISAFMTYAEVATGSMTLHPAAIELLPRIKRALEDIAPRAHERSVGLPPLPSIDPDRIIVHADANAVDIVLDELLIDAVESAPIGGEVRLDVQLAGAAAVVHVLSSGDPIPDEVAEATFVPFNRDCKGSRVSAAAHALSLPTARALARSLGGDVAVSQSALLRSLLLTLPLHG
ncbi:MAG: HAMP domain-containing sensor histidine kinase [Gemmatimonas sp.]